MFSEAGFPDGGRGVGRRSLGLLFPPLTLFATGLSVPLRGSATFATATEVPTALVGGGL